MVKKSYKKSYKKKRSNMYGGLNMTRIQNTARMAIQAYKGVNYLKGLVNSELFKYDQIVASTDPVTGSNFAIYNLTSIAIGDQVASRTGNSIFLRSVLVKGTVRYSPNSSLASALTNLTSRLSLVEDTQQVGDSVPTITDIYTNTNSNAVLNVNTVGRFKILKTSTFTLTKGNNEVKEINWFIQMRHHVRYNGDSGSDIQKGGIYLIITSDTTVAADCPIHYFSLRTSYHDN